MYVIMMWYGRLIALEKTFINVLARHILLLAHGQFGGRKLIQIKYKAHFILTPGKILQSVTVTRVMLVIGLLFADMFT